MNKVLIFIIIMLLPLSILAQGSTEEVVFRVIKEQERAWNNYNLKGFMEGYWQSDSLQFVTARGITYGWKNMLNHYRQGYPDKESTGTLVFSQLQFRELSPDYCFVTGRWEIKRRAGVIAGFFTLLFKKIKGEWRIVVDHTD